MRFPNVVALLLLSTVVRAECTATVDSSRPFDKRSIVSIQVTDCDPASASKAFLWAGEVKLGGFDAVRTKSGSTLWDFRLRNSAEAGDAEKERTLLWDRIAQNPTVPLFVGAERATAVAAGEATLYSRPVVTDVRSGQFDCYTSSGCSVTKGAELSLVLANLADLRALAKDEKIYLYLDGKPVGAEAGALGEPNQLRFRLASRPEKELLASWKAILAAKGYSEKPMRVAVGTLKQELTSPGLPHLGEIRIQRIEEWRLTGWLLFVVILACAMVYLGVQSDLLRERCPLPPPPARRAFSLAVCQMAWWFFITVASFSFYWAVLGEELTIPPNLLALIGIAGATGALAYTVDLVGDKNTKPIESEGFLRDLLRSSNGIELSRLQMVVWTILFGVMVVQEFAATLTLPDPSATSLTLLGLASGLYVGFKVPQTKT